MSQIKAKFKCSEEDKAKFKESRCLLTISVGQAAHEGEKFAATVDLVNRSFKSCIILLGDTLQRHSMALNIENTPECFYQASLKAGDSWLERNKQYYGQLALLEKIIRWDYWLNHKDYAQSLNKVSSLIQTDASYGNCFEDSITEYLVRYKRRLGETFFNESKAHELCLNYLMEECAALCLWSELNCQIELYVDQHNSAMQETKARFIADSEGFFKAAAIQFGS